MVDGDELTPQFPVALSGSGKRYKRKKAPEVVRRGAVRSAARITPEQGLSATFKQSLMPL
jgi:hypothetical protein